MDKKTLVAGLNRFFCELSEMGKPYSSAWVELKDPGGHDRDFKVTLNVRVDDKIPNSSNESKDIIFRLYEKARDIYNHIWTVRIHPPDDWAYYKLSDVVVYQKAES